MAHLARQTLGDQGLEQEVLRLFDDSTRAYFRRLEHSTSVEELLRHLQAELRDGQPVNPERIDDLGMAIAECSAFIEELLGTSDE